MVLNRGIACLQPLAMGVGGLERYTAVDTVPQITPALIQGRGSERVAPLVDGKGTQEYRLHARRTHRISSFDGKLIVL